MRAPKGHTAGRKEKLSAGWEIGHFTAGGIYFALGGGQFHARQLSRATCDKHMKPGQQGAVSSSLQASVLNGPPGAAWVQFLPSM